MEIVKSLFLYCGLIFLSPLFARNDTSNLLHFLKNNDSGDLKHNLSINTQKLDILLKNSPDHIKQQQSFASLDTLLEKVLEQQNNPDYQEALKILSDEKLRIAYHDALNTMQLFFLDYRTQILQQRSGQQEKNISLTNLLQKITSNTAKSQGTSQPADLIQLLQNHSQSQSLGTQQSVINLDALLQNHESVPGKVTSKVPLNRLLHIKSMVPVSDTLKSKENLSQMVNSSLGDAVQPKKKSNNLLNLLPVEQES